MSDTADSITTSIVVIAYDMARELPRTLSTLRAAATRAEQPCEIVIVDNGSAVPVEVHGDDDDTPVRVIRLDDAPASPARAANVGIDAAHGALIGVIIDGARMVSPGLIDHAQRAAATHPRAVITSPAYHLGSDVQNRNAASGYDETEEDRLLQSIEWRADGYELFGISVLAPSSARGWFRPAGESSSLFMSRELWREHGGYDEIFDRPGGGLLNHDVWRRANEIDSSVTVCLLGEGTFHQYHGGASTGGRDTHDELWSEYEALRGAPYSPPERRCTYLGTLPDAAMHHLRASIGAVEAGRDPDRAQLADLQQRAGVDRARIAELERLLDDARREESWVGYVQRRARNVPASIRRRRRERAMRQRIEAERQDVSAAEIARRRSVVEGFLAAATVPDAATSTTAQVDAPITPLPTDDEPTVSVIIPVHNAIPDLLACLASFHTHPPQSAYEIIIANDCSDETDFEPIRHIGGLRIIDNPTNLGFLLNCNAAAAQATGDYLWFLNSDTELTGGAVDALLETFVDFPDAVIAGSKLLNSDGSLQEAGGIVWSDGSAWNYGRGSAGGRSEVNYARHVDYVSGAALMARASFFRAAGGFDTAFSPAYYEDTDLCMQATAAGHQVIYQPASAVIHHEGGSHGTDTADTSSIKHHQVENQVTFARKWQSRLHTHGTNGTAPEFAKERHLDGRVLVIDARMLSPDRDAGSLRMLHTLRALRDHGWKVTFVPQNLQCDEPMTATLQRQGVEVVGTPDIRFIDDFLADRGQEFDVVVLSRLEVARDLLGLVRDRCPNALIVYDTVDLHFLRLRRQLGVDDTQVAIAEVERIEADEIAAVERADLTLVVSTAEADLLAELTPDAAVEVLGLVHELHPTEPDLQRRSGLLFVGGFEHGPNVDGVRWFVKQALPSIVAQRPDTVLHIVGSNMPPEIESLRDRHVVTHGFVPDLTSLYESVRVAIAPLRFGAGVKGKVTEAMAFGVPVVATTIATEGTSFRNERDLLIADDPAEYAAACLRLIDDDAAWIDIRTTALESIDAEFGVARASERVGRILAIAEQKVRSAQ